MIDSKDGRVHVADGRVHPYDVDEEERVLHCNIIPSDIVRVSVDEVVKGYEHARVPVPAQDCDEIGGLIGAVVGWNKCLVELCVPQQVLISHLSFLRIKSRTNLHTLQLLKCRNKCRGGQATQRVLRAHLHLIGRRYFLRVTNKG